MSKVAYVHHGFLRQPHVGAEPILVGNPDWFAWLELNSAFAFASAEGHFTARKEQSQRDDPYWKAYRKRGAKAYHTYLGRSQDLTLERLQLVAQALAPGDDSPLANENLRAAGNDLARTIQSPAFSVSPLLANFLSRSRLFSPLRANRRLTVLTAPSGYGKTALVADWTRADQRKTAWVSLTKGHNDPTCFWSAVAAALDALWGGVGRRTRAWLRLAQPMSLNAILPTLLRDVATHVVANGHGYPAVLVLDDYHVIANPVIHDSVVAFLEKLSPQLRLVISSRDEPPLPLAHLHAQGYLAELRSQDLRFDLDEATKYVRTVSGCATLKNEFTASLNSRLRGQIGALRWVALLMRSGLSKSEIESRFLDDERRTFNDLIADTIARQPTHVHEFLLATAVLDRFCAELCDAVADNRNPVKGRQATEFEAPAFQSQFMLVQLERVGLFIVAADEQGGWYRHLPMVAEALLQRLRAVKPEQEPVLRQRASDWLARNGFVAEAIEHAVDGADWPHAVDLIERTAHPVWERGENATVRHWLNALPEPFVKARPQLCLMQAMLHMERSRLPEAAESLDEVERRLAVEEVAKSRSVSSLQQDTIAIRARARILRSQLAMYSPQVIHGQRVTQSLAQALADLPDGDFIWRAAGNTLLGDLAYQIDDLARAEHAYADAAVAARGGHAYGMVLGGLGLRAETLVASGRLTEAQMLCEDTSRLAVEWGLDALPMHSDVAMATIHYERNELAYAEQVILREIERLERIGLIGLRFRSLLVLCQLRLARGDTGSALQILKRLEASLESQTHALAYSQATSAWRARIRFARWLHAASTRSLHESDQPDQAAVLNWVREVGAHVNPAADPLTHIAHRPKLTMFVRAHLLQDKAEVALSLLHVLKVRAKLAGAKDMLIELLALEALTLDRLERRSNALDSLSQALALGEPEGYSRTFIDQGAPLATLLQRLVARRERRYTKQKEYALRLLGAFR